MSSILQMSSAPWLYSLTQGNPQLLTLAIHMLQSGGDLEGLIQQMATTVSVEQYILHEIDGNITQDERKVMKALSVLDGYPASKRCIESVAQNHKLTSLLNSLVVRNLVTTTGSNGSTLYSQHSMVQQFYYQSLHDAEQDKLHRRAGDYYKETETEADLLKAANQYVGHAQGAMQVLDTLIAEEKVDLSKPDLRLPINLSKANIHRARGTFAEAQVLLEELALEEYPDQEQAQIAYELGLIYSRQSRYREALTTFQKVLDTPDAFVDHMGLARLHDSIGWAYRGTGDFELARTHFELGHQESILANDLYTICDTDLGLGLLDWQDGKLDKAEQRFTTSRDRLKQSGFVWAEGSALNNLALVYCEKEEYEQAIEYFGEAAELYELVGKIDGLIIVHVNQGELHYNARRYEESFTHFTQVTTLACQTQNDLYISRGCYGVSKCMVAQGKLEEAETHILEAQKIAEENDYSSVLGLYYRIHGELCLQKGQNEEAARYFSKSVPLLEIEHDIQEIELAEQGLQKALD